MRDINKHFPYFRPPSPNPLLLERALRRLRCSTSCIHAVIDTGIPAGMTALIEVPCWSEKITIQGEEKLSPVCPSYTRNQTVRKKGKTIPCGDNEINGV
jgi:hypothetical protein